MTELTWLKWRSCVSVTLVLWRVIFPGLGCSCLIAGKLKELVVGCDAMCPLLA